MKKPPKEIFRMHGGHLRISEAIARGSSYNCYKIIAEDLKLSAPK